MDELTIEDLRQLVIFYNKRANEAELKNAEFQLFTNRLKIEKTSLESKIKNLELEVEKLYKRPDPDAVQKSTEKVSKVKESK
jgi:hypothetical protein